MSDDKKPTYEELEAELARIKQRLGEEPKTLRVLVEPGLLEVEMEHFAVRAIVHSLWETFDKLGGENFVTMNVGGHPRGPIEVTIRPEWGGKKTPAQVIGELRARIAKLEAKR